MTLTYSAGQVAPHIKKDIQRRCKRPAHSDPGRQEPGPRLPPHLRIHQEASDEHSNDDDSNTEDSSGAECSD